MEFLLYLYFIYYLSHKKKIDIHVLSIGFQVSINITFIINYYLLFNIK
jgi:hypothetical protein